MSTVMYRCASTYGNGSINTLSITLKIAVDAPIPNASVTIAVSANPRPFQRVRTAYRISCRRVSTSILPPLATLNSAITANGCLADRLNEAQSTVHQETEWPVKKFLSATCRGGCLSLAPTLARSQGV